MSETSSDTESSCGWTLISNEGSDIESLGLDQALEFGNGPASFPPVREPDLLVPTAGCFEGKSDPLDETVLEETFEETMSASEALGGAASQEHVALCSSSDLSSSDIMTLGDMKELEDEEDEEDEERGEPAANEESYMGTSSSSQYTFTAVETAGGSWRLPQTLWRLGLRLRLRLTGSSSLPVLPAQPPPPPPSSSSSEDESVGGAATALRRRRPRRNTGPLLADPPEGGAPGSGQSEEEQEQEQAEEQKGEEEREEEGEEVPKAHEARGARVPGPGEAGCSLNTCVLLMLLVAVSISVGHSYGQPQQGFPTHAVCRDPDAVLEECLRTFFKDEDLAWFPKEELNHRSFVEMIINISKENEELNIRQTLLQAQGYELEVRLQQGVEERALMEAQGQRLASEKQQLQSSLEQEQRSLWGLQEELRALRSEVARLGARGADPLVSENQRLTEQLEARRALGRGMLSQRDAAMAETRSLRKELDRERRFTEGLREELEQLAGSSAGAEQSQAETQTRLTELEKRLGFEQQRSDLWERLYVESKEEKAKGDTPPRAQKSKEGMAGKLKKTFEAVKNSSKEFVHHHKEQLKKAKEAVKENLRKFSDSVKSTFRHFKDSASTLINKATAESKRFNNAKGPWDFKGPWDTKGPWQQGPHRPQHSHSSESTEGHKRSQNTRKSGDKVHEDGDTQSQREAPRRGARVFNRGFKGSQSLFGEGTEPVRADEFHQLLQSYLHQEVEDFHHWRELDRFINKFFLNGVFIHDQMLFKDFVGRVEDYLENMHEYYGLDDGVFADLDEYVDRHFYGESNTKSYGPRPTEGPSKQTKESLQVKQQQQQQQRARSRPQRERRSSRSGGNSDTHMADVKIELGPLPFDPKY
ncbi:cell cycle progression protein 1 isoform X1 [Gadus chalcogrammus]|uniref:cell cycle progression protein 1 isoform X1 n=1 Tax=Gadus chalcogrammus TaxID=1042646 RepID=UPI0024C4E5BE|nr:cell cycle progression protein 1 isoform X1 [Gadus chalcogrammus]XP_056463691.1 cell cycle progression protein 1 isoform X1 [Gadus chalcogrammus]